MKVIAFGHKKRVGKDTAVTFALSFVRQYYPTVKCQRVSFGDEIKRISYSLFSWAGLNEAVYYDNNPKEREEILPAVGMSPRQIWIEAGSRLAEISPILWPELAFGRLGESDLILISDLRRSAEVDYVRKFNGKCVKILRAKAPHSSDVCDDALDYYDSWDHVIENDGSLKEFNGKIKALVIETLNPVVALGLKVCSECFSKGEAIMTQEGMVCRKCQKQMI